MSRNAPAATPYRRILCSNNKCNGSAGESSYLNHYKKVYILKIVDYERACQHFCSTAVQIHWEYQEPSAAVDSAMRTWQTAIVVLATGACVLVFVAWMLFSGVIKEQVFLQACGQGSIRTVRFLLDRGVNVDARDGWNGSCMFYASANGSVEIVDLLLSKGINVDATYRMNRTALIMAAANGRLEIVKTLISKGADTRLRDTDGKTALDHALEQKKSDVVKFLNS